MDDILGQVLRNAVWERLDMLTELAAHGGDPAVVDVARSELPKLTDGWRSLLAAHEPDAKGNCPECSSRWRQQRSPCAIWRAAYDHLAGGGLAPKPARKSRLSRRCADVAPAVAPVVTPVAPVVTQVVGPVVTPTIGPAIAH